ncbi:hypothetical protein [Nocardia sp. NPDC003183]
MRSPTPRAPEPDAPGKLTAAQLAAASAAGQHIDDLVPAFGVSRPTLDRYLAEAIDFEQAGTCRQSGGQTG